MNVDIITIEGELIKVAPPNTFVGDGLRTGPNEYFLGVKTDDAKRVLVRLNTKIMGWSGNLNESRIWYFKPDGKTLVKAAMRDPEKYLAEYLRIKGVLIPINRKNKKYRMDYVHELIILL